VGRPEFFDEEDSPIGVFQTPAVRAAASEVPVEDPVTVTIRVVAAGPVQRPPRLLRLEKFPGFSDQFYVEYSEDAAFRRVDDRTWELTCALKPKSVNVKAIPSFPFVSFTPGLVPPERGYQIHRTASVPLVVRPRVAVHAADVSGGGEAPSIPETILEIAEGPALSHRGSALSPEALLTIAIAGFCIPPLACLAWCIAWLRTHPDATRAARWQRSHAAQVALAELRRPGDDAASQAAFAVSRYLRQRFDLPSVEPTPAEVAADLARAGCDAALAERIVAFFRACDAARYAHVPLAQRPEITARQLVLDLEAELCPLRASS
jgi:hypothetical protein